MKIINIYSVNLRILDLHVVASNHFCATLY